MSGLVIGLIVAGVVAIVLIGMLIGIYNKLVSLSQRYKNAFSQIEVQLQRRYDLIPNLVETAKGYLKHEKETLENVIQARNQAAAGLKAAAGNPGDAAAMAQLNGGEGALAGAMSRLMVVMEAYPDLKANQNMMQVSEELTSTENKVAFSRQAFNDSVTAYNIYRRSFPPIFFAPLFGHATDASLLEFESEKIADAPQVSFS